MRTLELIQLHALSAHNLVLIMMDYRNQHAESRNGTYLLWTEPYASALTSKLHCPLVSHSALMVLDPKTISSATEYSVRALRRQRESANTRASYGAALRYWGAWYSASYGHALRFPLPAPVDVHFITDHAEREVELPEASIGQSPAVKRRRKGAIEAEGQGGRARAGGAVGFRSAGGGRCLLVEQGYKGKRGALALNTLSHRVSVISKAHQNADVDNQCNHPEVRKLLGSVRRSYAARGVKPTQQTALTKKSLELLLARCDNPLRGKRDRALLLFAWASGRRPMRRWKTCPTTASADMSTFSRVRSRTRRASKTRRSTNRSLALGLWPSTTGWP